MGVWLGHAFHDSLRAESAGHEDTRLNVSKAVCKKKKKKKSLPSFGQPTTKADHLW